MLVRALLLLTLPFAEKGVEESRVLARRHLVELELTTDAFELGFGEEDRGLTQEGPRYVREEANEVDLVDTIYGDGNPPERFERLYQTVVSSQKMGPEEAPQERLINAGVEGSMVTFVREEGGRYSRTSDDDAARPGHLRRLRAVLSLAPFLPGADVEPGESWEIPGIAFLRLASPIEAGRSRGRRRPRSKAPDGGLDLAPASFVESIGTLLAAVDGTATATEVEPGEGDELPRMAALEFRLESHFDPGDGLLGGREGEAEGELQLVFEGSGTLAWDPEDGTIEVSCNGELQMKETFQLTIEAGGHRGDVRGMLEVSGTLELEGREGPEE